MAKYRQWGVVSKSAIDGFYDVREFPAYGGGFMGRFSSKREADKFNRRLDLRNV